MVSPTWGWFWLNSSLSHSLSQFLSHFWNCVCHAQLRWISFNFFWFISCLSHVYLIFFFCLISWLSHGSLMFICFLSHCLPHSCLTVFLTLISYFVSFLSHCLSYPCVMVWWFIFYPTEINQIFFKSLQRTPLGL